MAIEPLHWHGNWFLSKPGIINIFGLGAAFTFPKSSRGPPGYRSQFNEYPRQFIKNVIK
jgi:hypothetical protein